MEQTHLLLQSVLLGLGSTWWVPTLLKRRPAGYQLGLLAIFLALFGLNYYFLAQRFSAGETLIRSLIVGAIPLVGGYVFARATTPRK